MENKDQLSTFAFVMSLVGFGLIVAKSFFGFTGLAPIILILAVVTSACFFMSSRPGRSGVFNGCIWAFVAVLVAFQILR